MVSKRRRVTIPTDVTEASEDLQAISDRNSTESRLLTLPPEIRNRIFLYALGNGTIHAWRDQLTGRLRLTVCSSDKCTESPIENAVKYYVGSRPARRHYAYPCTTQEPVRLPLALLETCRQIYAEAALIPFATNCFQIPKDAFEDFAYGIMAFQKRAIKSLDLGFGFGTGWGYFEKHVAMAFKGLQELKVVAFHGEKVWVDMEAIECFEGLPLRNFSIRQFQRRVGEIQSFDHAALRSRMLETGQSRKKKRLAKQQKDEEKAQVSKVQYDMLKKKDDDGLHRAVDDGGQGSARALRRLKRQRSDDGS